MQRYESDASQLRAQGRFVADARFYMAIVDAAIPRKWLRNHRFAVVFPSHLAGATDCQYGELVLLIGQSGVGPRVPAKLSLAENLGSMVLMGPRRLEGSG